jgi:hypothetical protein
MHRVFLFSVLLLTSCSSTKLQHDDEVLSAYTSGLIDGATAAPLHIVPCPLVHRRNEDDDRPLTAIKKKRRVWVLSIVANSGR